MRCFAATIALLGTLALAPAAHALPRAGVLPPLRSDAAARLVSCRSALDASARSLTAESVMRSLRAGDRMQMRFDLFHRLPGDTRPRRLAGPGLGTWKRAAPGVQRLRVRKPIHNLPAPGHYRVRVRYRWEDAAGRTFARTARWTRTCVQSDLRPDLRIAAVGTPRRVGPDAFAYPLVLHNAGRSASRGFDLVAEVDGAATDPRRTRGLAAGERRVVQVVVRCPAGARISFVLDPDDRVAERDELNNARGRDCP